MLGINLYRPLLQMSEMEQWAEKVSPLGIYTMASCAGGKLV